MDYKQYFSEEELKTSKNIKLYPCTPTNLLRSNPDLFISHIAYKFLNLEPDMLIPTMIHIPEQIMKRGVPIDCGNLILKVFNSSEIYTVMYSSPNKGGITGSLFTRTVVSMYNVVIKLFSRCRLRFIDKDKSYVAYVSPHSPEVLISLRDILVTLGFTDDELFRKRLIKCLNITDSNTPRVGKNCAIQANV